jgi:hypothetical protein
MRALVVALAVAGCAHTACPPARPHPAGGPFLWEVTGGSGVVYLFGTLHAAGPEDVPAPARAALARSTRFVDEIGALPPDEVRAQALLPRGQGLQQLLGADDWYELRDAVPARVTDETLGQARPWYAMALLTSAMAPGPELTMDDALADDARAQGAAVEHLETAEQLGALAASVSVADLKQAIAERRTMRCGVADLLAAYRAGDGDALRGELAGDTGRKLLDERNARWLARLEALLHGGGGFVAVGVDHLVGPGSVPELLAARGWRVVRAP